MRFEDCSPSKQLNAKEIEDNVLQPPFWDYRCSKHCLFVSALGAWREINKMAALSARCVRTLARASIQISVSYIDKQAKLDELNFLT